jgi:hypothetical protein
MSHEDAQVASNGKDGRHRHEEDDNTSSEHGLWRRLSRPWRGDRDWLDQSWKDAKAFLDCKECVPSLTDSQRETLRVRWLREAQHYDQLWRGHRLRDDIFRVLIVIGAATVPVLAGLDVGRLPVALVGLAVAILAGFDVFQLRERWRQLRETATLMTREGWRFLELTGPYSLEESHRTAYKGFLNRLEELNATQTEKYLSVYNRTPPPGSANSESKG